MDIHLLFNGLGNQLSQYAFFLNKRRLGQSTQAYYAFGGTHNGSELERLFGIHLSQRWHLRFARAIFRVGASRRFYSKAAADFVMGLFRIKIVIEQTDNRFDPELLKPWFGLRFLVGGWHDARYFDGAESLVRESFRFPDLDERNQSFLRQIESSHSVSIHIRRGDYLTPENLDLFGNIATVDYYRNVIGEVRKESQTAGWTPMFFIFSDDMGWCREVLPLSNAVFVNINSGKDSWKDLVLMSHCKVNILANSTFSWWAAWLNPHPDKRVYCPTKFISTDQAGQTIYLKDWRQVIG